ncbi:hypothetical protein EVAR_51196_1, partial [Eumeta japonica]
IFLAARFEEKQEKPENTWPRVLVRTSGNGAIYQQKRALTTSSTPYPAHPYDFRFRARLGKPEICAPSRRTGVPNPKIFSWPVPEEIGKTRNHVATRSRFLSPRTTRDTSGDTGAEGEPKTVYRSPLRLVVPARSKPKSSSPWPVPEKFGNRKPVATRFPKEGLRGSGDGSN